MLQSHTQQVLAEQATVPGDQSQCSGGRGVEESITFIEGKLLPAHNLNVRWFDMRRRNRAKPRPQPCAFNQPNCPKKPVFLLQCLSYRFRQLVLQDRHSWTRHGSACGLLQRWGLTLACGLLNVKLYGLVSIFQTHSKCHYEVYCKKAAQSLHPISPTHVQTLHTHTQECILILKHTRVFPDCICLSVSSFFLQSIAALIWLHPLKIQYTLIGKPLY